MFYARVAACYATRRTMLPCRYDAYAPRFADADTLPLLMLFSCRHDASAMLTPLC